MDIKKQVISLELAKRLKELNCKQESLWWWCEVSLVDYDEKLIEILTMQEIVNKVESEKFEVKNLCSAFTVSELGEMLPL